MRKFHAKKKIQYIKKFTENFKKWPVHTEPCRYKGKTHFVTHDLPPFNQFFYYYSIFFYCNDSKEEEEKSQNINNSKLFDVRHWEGCE